MDRLQRTIHQWGDWKLLNFGGHDYELLHLCENIWTRNQSFHAHDDDEAIKITKKLIDDSLRKRVS